jgi:hypothetical protein
MELLLIETDQLGGTKSFSAIALKSQSKQKGVRPLAEEGAIQSQRVRSFVMVEECGRYY